MIATRGLGRSGTQSGYLVTTGLGLYRLEVIDGRIRIVRISVSADELDVRLAVTEAI